MSSDFSKTYRSIIRGMGQILALIKLYDPAHPIVKEKLDEVFVNISDFISKNGSLILAESPEATLLVNGEEVSASESLTKNFVHSFRSLKLGSLHFEPGLRLDELALFISLLKEAAKFKEDDQAIRQFLKDNSAVHLLPSFAAYKLVKDNEAIVRESEVIKLKDIPAEKLSSFIADFTSGNISKNLTQSKDKAYSFLAHDPEFLSLEAIGLNKESLNYDEIVKSAWLIGEYLIGEISTAKQEEQNRKILDEMKRKILAKLETKPEAAVGRAQIQEAFIAIESALEIRKIIVLYAKHKKELEKVLGRIEKIISVLPKDSSLYLKAKEDLQKIGPPPLSPEIFSQKGVR